MTGGKNARADNLSGSFAAAHFDNETRVIAGVQATDGLATSAIGVVVIGKTFPAILGA